MEEPKFEKEFREKLQARELKPDLDTWNRLKDRLDAQPQSMGGKRKWWFAGAVALVAGLMVVYSFWNLTPGYRVVTEEPAVKLERAREKENHWAPIIAEPGTVRDESVARGQHPNQAQRTKPKETDGQELVFPEFKARSLAGMEQGEEPEGPTEGQESLLAGRPLREGVEDSLISQKLDEVIAEARKLEDEHGKVSDAEIDALLLLAAQDFEGPGAKLGGKVDSESLLLEVEMELEASFRTKMFQLLKQGFERTRTAVVNGMQD